MIFALWAVLMLTMLAGCNLRPIDDVDVPATVTVTPPPKETTPAPTLSLTRTPKEKSEAKEKQETQEYSYADVQEEIVEDGTYYDVESVVLYYEMFGKLPGNYITKKEAKSLGWEGGSVDDFKKGAAIGGDHFGNYEKRLPEGAKYIECDIGTRGKGRGAKRLIISNKGEYYYTDDHYESFKKLSIKDGKVYY
jgi:hypothetical protein